MATIRVRRNGAEIFAAAGNPVLSFPSGTMLDCIEMNGADATVVLAEPNAKFERRSDGVFYGSSDSAVTYAELMLMKHGLKIQAIKSYRGRTLLGLKESKDAVEREFATWDAQQYPRW